MTAFVYSDLLTFSFQFWFSFPYSVAWRVVCFDWAPAALLLTFQNSCSFICRLPAYPTRPLRPPSRGPRYRLTLGFCSAFSALPLCGPIHPREMCWCQLIYIHTSCVSVCLSGCQTCPVARLPIWGFHGLTTGACHLHLWGWEGF